MKPDRHQLHLVRRAINRDGEAFLRLCRRYRSIIYRYFYFRTGTTTVAEEMTRDLFVRAWEQLPDLSDVFVSPALVWLLQLADDLVGEYKVARYLTGDPPKRPPLIAWSEHTTSGHLPQLNPRYVAQAIMQLDPIAQQVIVLRFMLHLSHEVTALVISDSEDGARALQYRSLIQLREVLSRKSMSQNAYASEHVGIASFCVDRIISGTWSVEQCLEHLPQQSEPFKETFHFALMVRQAANVNPRQSFESQFDEELYPRLKDSKRRPRRQPRLLQALTPQFYYLVYELRSFSDRLSPAQAVGAVVAAMFLLMTTGTIGAYAAVNTSVPGDRLYPLDLRFEERYLSRLDTPEAKTRFRLKLTEERLREAGKLAKRGDSGGLRVALVAYSLEVGAIIDEPTPVQQPDAYPDLDMAFAEQQKELDEIFSVLLRNQEMDLATGSATDIRCTDASADAAGSHPIAMTLSAQFDNSYDEILEWVCDGHSFGGIVLALASGKRSQATPAQLLQMKAQLGGWGELWEELHTTTFERVDGPGVTPDPAQTDGERSATPGRGRPSGIPGPPDGRGQPDGVGPPDGGGPPDEPGPPDGVGPPDDPGPPDGVGPPDDPGPPDGVGPPDDPGPPDEAGPPGEGGPPGGGPPGR